ncbi:MAG: AAA family ATPase [Eubacterium sp.]|nr:AAA family ATPase [Eubacterium sp.]
MVFDFKKQTVTGQKAGDPICTYTVFDSQADRASVEEPIMVLADQEKKLPHHQNGTFLNPHKQTGFRYRADEKNGSSSEIGEDKTADILRIDRRFVKLLDWLGENQIFVKLSGGQREDGYGIYKIHAVTTNGRSRAANDGFLQMVIERLLASRVQEEELNEDGGFEDAEEDRVMLTDMSAMIDFLSCAGSALPANVRRWAQRNIALVRAGNVSPEEKRHAQRALSMMLNIQWKGSYFESVDPVEARRILDEALYGMEKVKQRIIETIIQINRTHTLPAYGILLAGPAGVGKSQLAYAVARILKLPWAALDMSAIHDSEALSGSPRVYANAKPGLIMEAFSGAGTSNVVFIINELDKADSGDSAGNPADALLTLLDNLGYTDNYIECMIPTGGVYPIATANDKNRISAPLMSRFAVIDIPDYTPEEKKTIFTQFSLPKVLKRMGMREDECIVPEEAVDEVIARFGSLPGCRDLEQAAEHLAANALYQIETKHVEGVRFDAEAVRQLLAE